MTHYTDSEAFGIIEGLNGQFGAAVNVPTNFFKSGVANIYEGYFGSSTGMDFAALNVGPSPTAVLSMSLKGLSKFQGLHTQEGGLVVNGYVDVKGGSYRCTSTTTSFECNSFGVSTGGSNTFTAGGSNRLVAPNTVIDSPTSNITGILNLTGVGNVAAAINSKKSFDIPHPTKPNYRLRHACVEGPEAAIYFRGRLLNSNIIKLPEYWNGLADLDTITVNLTQIGHSQDLMVDKIQWGSEIVIKSGNGTSIDCFYEVWADRLGEKLIVEYEGQTPQDYPGNNFEYSVVGWNYDKR